MDRTVHLAELPALETPALCVLIDTEEEFDWFGPLSSRNISVQSMSDIRRGQEIFRRYGLRPAYLVDYPVIADPRSAEVFGPWVEAGDCLIGAQLHPWVTPPHEEVVCPYNSYPCNLDADLERRKLAALTEKIQATLGIAPRIYKAGRYGLDLTREAMLSELGYRVDTSVVPYRSFAGAGGGPNFFGYPNRLFWSSPERRVLYLPVTQSLIGPLRFLRRHAASQRIFGRLSSSLHLPGILARLHLLERIMLTPEGVSFVEMRKLVDSMLADGDRVFAFSLHSPSLMPGGTPYVRTDAERDGFLARIDRFLDYFFGTIGGQAVTPLDLLRMAEAPSRRAEPVAVASPA